ncbi:MAG: hypothetical protein Q7R81_03040 [Candidatus Peregrinibacteria bacterium]|nr:hypothetical protein [Candidatus Peregrinibacteria bacterium]
MTRSHTLFGMPHREALHRFSKVWNAWWFRQAPPHALALYRIIFGSFLVLYWGLLLPDAQMLFSTSGISIPRFDATTSILPFLSVLPTPWVANALLWLLLLCFTALTLGCCMRIACVAALLLMTYFYAISYHLTWFTMEHVTVVMLIAFLISGADRAFSLRMLRRKGSFFAWEPASVLAQRLIAVQVTATFLGAGWLKLVMPAWIAGGEILPYSFISRWATPIGYWAIHRNLPMWFYDLSVYSVKFFEFFLPFGFWIPKIRILAFGLLTLFLTSIAVTLSFWWFLVLVPSCILFVEPEEFYERLRKRSGGRIR